MNTPKPSDDRTQPRSGLLRLPREIMTAEQGYWAAARLPRVATAFDDEAPRPSAHGSRHDVSIVKQALRQIVAFLC